VCYQFDLHRTLTGVLGWTILESRNSVIVNLSKESFRDFLITVVTGTGITLTRIKLNVFTLTLSYLVGSNDFQILHVVS